MSHSHFNIMTLLSHESSGYRNHDGLGLKEKLSTELCKT